jgi:hypothetical protein
MTSRICTSVGRRFSRSSRDRASCGARPQAKMTACTELRVHADALCERTSVHADSAYDACRSRTGGEKKPVTPARPRGRRIWRSAPPRNLPFGPFAASLAVTWCNRRVTRPPGSRCGFVRPLVTQPRISCDREFRGLGEPHGARAGSGWPPRPVTVGREAASQDSAGPPEVEPARSGLSRRRRRKTPEVRRSDHGAAGRGAGRRRACGSNR